MSIIWPFIGSPVSVVCGIGLYHLQINCSQDFSLGIVNMLDIYLVNTPEILTRYGV